MAYKNLVGVSCADRASVFRHVRDFLCKLNGIADYSVSGIGWTVHDSSYAVSADAPAVGDWVVIHSHGEGGNDDLYFKITFATSYITVFGFLYWNATTHVGVQQFQSADNWSCSGAATLWVYGDLDSIATITKEGIYFYGALFGKTDTLYDDTPVTSASSIPASASTVVSVTPPTDAGWITGRKLFIRDTATVGLATILDVGADYVTLNTGDTSYLAGAKISADIGYFCCTGGTTDLPTNGDGQPIGLIGHSGLTPTTYDTVGNSMGAEYKWIDPLNSERMFARIQVFNATYGWGGAIKNVLYNGKYLTTTDPPTVETFACGASYRRFGFGAFLEV